MMKKTPPQSSSRPRHLSGGPSGSLIDWSEPERNAHVLDWRERAYEFGLVPVEDDGTIGAPVIESPERLLEEEEPEAADDQHLDSVDEVLPSEEIEEAPEARLSREELDPVRVYLKHI